MARAAKALLAFGVAAVFLHACTRGQPGPELRVESARQAALWTAAGPMAAWRCNHAAAPLGSGRVLLCGGLTRAADGIGRSGPTASCEIYTPGQGFAAISATLREPRYVFTLTATGAGQAVSIGGLTADAYAGLVETFTASPGGGSFSLDPNAFVSPRHSHATVALSGGELLVIGGVGPNGQSVSGDERLTDGAWESAGSTRRAGHTATLLASGDVLVVGGQRTTTETTVLSSYLVYDANANDWSTEGVLGEARTAHSATLLPNGDVLVAGGVNGETLGNYLRTATRYRPSTNSWIATASMSTARANHAAALVGGRVVVAGGRNGALLDSVEVYDPATNRWATLAPLSEARSHPTMTIVDERRVLVAGGCLLNSLASNAAELLRPALVGEACTAAARECLSGFCVEGTCCETACNQGYACSGGSCATTCADHGDCQATHYCDDGTCVENRPQGGVCTEDRNCAGGRPCVDGRCCDRECEQCEACDVAEQEGTCQRIAGPPRPGRAPCDGIGAGTTCGAVCDESEGACVYPTDTACGANTCAGGLETHEGTCSRGICSEAPRECGNYACNAAGTACRTSCEVNAHCRTGFVCRDEVCVVVPDLGEECTAGAECELGFCVDGVCCEDECAEGFQCDIRGKPGFCVLPNGAACERASHCASDHCVDGVCCSRPCAGQCEACDVEGAEGTCTPVVGRPHDNGRRPECDGGDRACGARACDGTTRESCAGFVNGAEFECAPARCEGATYTPAATCDGTGSCVEPLPIPCGAYRCADASSPCPDSCSADADCVEGNACREGQCRPAGFCEDDGVTFRAENGDPRDCTPFRCAADRCLDACSTLAECAPGYNCDPDSGNCVSAPDAAAADDGGGCGCKLPGQRPSPGGAGAAALVVFALLAARRRVRKRFS